MKVGDPGRDPLDEGALILTESDGKILID